ncbi:MAG TPA: alkyl sulfatase dimerization domain-containing protein [Acidimicrobiia bacterium]|nr:alkyl sulfatase dimerization domain-containing protein [Acidimicrobiia bacterium]
MTTDLLELSEKIWTGAAEARAHHWFAHLGEVAAPLPDTVHVAAFANVNAIATDDGMVVVDTSSPVSTAVAHQALQAWDPRPAHTIVYTHGHIDHVFGVERYEAAARESGAPAVKVVAHEGVSGRFDRYIATAGYNQVINRRQFQSADFEWPRDYRYPDETYRDKLELDVGGVRFELHHARGETDDHTWVWQPDRRVLFCGDLFCWVSPNCGNPQKVQRYPKDWAVALRAMAGMGAEILLPGHGLPIVDAGRIATSLEDAAMLLESVHDQTVAMMNGGARLDDIVNSIEYPNALLEKPYLQPIYDEPEFIVRNTWRLYGGWYDGNPANLKPAPDAEVGRAVAELAGGAGPLAERARDAADAGHLRLAGHLAEWAALAAPDDAEVQRARADVNQARVKAEASTMSKGVFSWAAAESSAKADGD